MDKIKLDIDWELFFIVLVAVLIGGGILIGIAMLVKRKKDKDTPLAPKAMPTTMATPSASAKTADANNSTNNPTPAPVVATATA